MVCWDRSHCASRCTTSAMLQLEIRARRFSSSVPALPRPRATAHAIRLLTWKRPGTFVDVAAARWRVAEIGVLLIELDRAIEHHLDGGALGQHRIRTARHQNGDQTRGGASGSTDTCAHPDVSGSCARDASHGGAYARGFRYGLQVAGLVALALDLAFGFV